MILECIIVDDEPLALSLLEQYINKTSYLRLVKKFSSAKMAKEWLESNKTSLVFLDIHMPDITGLEIAKNLKQQSASGNMKVIFTTAFSQYAIEGYKVEAIDYLLKPFNYSDFQSATQKALQFFNLVRQPTQALFDLQEFIYVKVAHKRVKIDMETIRYFESAKDYVKVFLVDQNQPLMAYSTLKKLYEQLPNDKFVQIHRSFIIALSKINTVTKNSVSIAGVTIPVTDNFRENFLKYIKDWH